MSGATDFVVTLGGGGGAFLALGFFFVGAEVVEGVGSLATGSDCVPGTNAGASALNPRSFASTAVSTCSPSGACSGFVKRPSNRLPVLVVPRSPPRCLCRRLLPSEGAPSPRPPPLPLRGPRRERGASAGRSDGEFWVGWSCDDCWVGGCAACASCDRSVACV